MRTSRVAGALIIASALVLSLATSVANAQSASASTTCVIAQRDLTTQEQSQVNDYEVLVARANSKHTAVPLMPDTVFALIGCESPASQTAQSSAGSSTTTSTLTSAPANTSISTSASSTASTFTCPPNGLSKDQESMINDFEILVARANSKHTPVPAPSADVAALIACQ